MLRHSFLMLLSLLWLFFGIASSASATKADPAIIHANAIRHGNIAYKEGYFGAGDARLHYVVAGKGPLIILYHGFPSFWYCWFDQMEALKTQYRVVAVDALGAGLSAKPTTQNAYRIEKLATQIDGLARHLNGGKRFTLIGHDWGAALAFAYAQAYPDRLNAVIGISAPPYNQFLDLVRTNAEQRTRSNYMQVFHQLSLAELTASGLPQRLWEQSYLSLISSGDLSPEEGELFRKALADPYAINGGMNWYRANIPLFATISKRDYWPAANPTIKVPTLVISGSADMIFVSDFLLHINDYAPDAKIVTLPNINHWATIEKSTFATVAITQFLRENQLSAVRLLGDQAAVIAAANAANLRSKEITEARLRNGMISRLAVLEANRLQLQSARDAAQNRFARYVATIGLIRALGGGWGDGGAPIKLGAIDKR